MTALAAPTVNAYRRLRHGELNGYWANWGVEHRCAGNRVPRGPGSHMRIESRIGDGTANVHTLVATVLQAARLGVVGGLECPDPMTTDGFDEVNTDVHCAHSLSAALDDMEADEALCEAVGSELCANFVFNKRAEWDRYTAGAGDDAVGDWDAITGTEPLTEWSSSSTCPTTELRIPMAQRPGRGPGPVRAHRVPGCPLRRAGARLASVPSQRKAAQRNAVQVSSKVWSTASWPKRPLYS